MSACKHASRAEAESALLLSRRRSVSPRLRVALFEMARATECLPVVRDNLGDAFPTLLALDHRHRLPAHGSLCSKREDERPLLVAIFRTGTLRGRGDGHGTIWRTSDATCPISSSGV
jgi:hypothetical protein